MESLCPICRKNTNWKYKICENKIDTCSICQDDNETHYGYLISCNHSFCIKCINIMKHNSKSNKLKPIKRFTSHNNVNNNVNNSEWPLLQSSQSSQSSQSLNYANVINNTYNRTKKFNINNEYWPSL